MATYNRRDQLVRQIEDAQREVEAAEAGADPFKTPGDRPPNDAPSTRLQVARETLSACRVALLEYDRENDPSRLLDDFTE